jgi:hypothetical protein
MKKTRPKQTGGIGWSGTPIVVNKHFTLCYYPDYLNPERFVRVFRSVWKDKLPLAARRPIAALWRKTQGTLWIVEELDETLACRRSAPLAGIAGRRHLEFLDACLLVPDHALRFTIAHELAHLYVLAIQDDPHAWEDEDEIDLIVTEWFNCESDRDWWVAEGKVWQRYTLMMHDDTRVDSLAELRQAFQDDDL